MRPYFELVIADLDLLGKLRHFNPLVIGTPPLGIDVSSSDIDIACSAKDLSRFCEIVSRHFHKIENFRIREAPHLHERTMVASFSHMGWEIELFCQNTRTRYQDGVRHFLVEQRLLSLEPRLQLRVRQLKQQGIKTEPAFANLLGLDGDPFVALLELEDMTDLKLRELIEKIQL